MKMLNKKAEKQWFVILFSGKSSAVYNLESKFKTKFKEYAIPNYKGESNTSYKNEFFNLVGVTETCIREMIEWYAKKGKELNLDICSKEQVADQNRILKAKRDEK